MANNYLVEIKVLWTGPDGKTREVVMTLAEFKLLLEKE